MVQKQETSNSARIIRKFYIILDVKNICTLHIKMYALCLSLLQCGILEKQIISDSVGVTPIRIINKYDNEDSQVTSNHIH